eukprot:gene10094-2514_t
MSSNQHHKRGRYSDDDYRDDRKKSKRYHDDYDSRRGYNKYDRGYSKKSYDSRDSRDRYDDYKHSSRKNDKYYDRRDEKYLREEKEKKEKELAEAQKELEEKEKKLKLEAWKKKLEEKKVLEKLKQEVKNKTVEVKNEENVLSLFSPSEEGSSSKLNILDNFENELKKEEDEKVEKEDEIDPLDAYMNEINQQVEELEKKEQQKTITLDDLKFKKEEEQVDFEDEEEFHKKFTEALKKGNKQVLESEVLYSEESDGHLLDDYMIAPEEPLLGQQDSENQEVKVIKQKKEFKDVDHSKIDYIPFRKNFYIQARELSNLTEEEIQKIRFEYDDTKVHGQNVPPPLKSWTQCGLSDMILNTLTKEGYEEPFAIQAQALPAIMSGRDVIGCAKTGSGKTCAFILPLLRHVLDQINTYPLEEGDGPIGLILSPTRELAVQIYGELKKFTKILKLKTLCAYGGASFSDQIAACKSGVHIVVCTPGRMIDLLCANKGRATNLQRVTYVCCDEADRMFDLGFGPQITKILDNIRPDRQTVMFSATMPKPLEALAKKTMKNPIEIMIGGRSQATDNVRQHVEVRSEETKFLRLLELLGIWSERGKILIFVEKQAEADQMFKDLTGSSYECLLLHGGMEQLERSHTLTTYKKSKKTILIATSVASRGLDVRGLNLVINYTCPRHREDYVHRIGRTGRAGKKGTAYTFITEEEERYASDIMKAIKQSKRSEISPEFEEMVKNFEEKKKKGLVFQKKLSGYTGSGLKEQKSKEEERKRQKKTLGLKDSDDEDEDENDKTKKKKKAIPSGLTKEQTLQLAKEYAATQLGIKNLNPSDEKEKTHIYREEIEINDYSQTIRSRMIQKDSLYQLTELFNVSIQCKGNYYAPGVKVPPDEKKLYILIEGTNKESMEQAKERILNLLAEYSREEGSIAGGPMRPLGKYTVL